MRILLLLACLIATSSASNSCYAPCNEPLGFESGKIKDSQITALSTFNSDVANYGAQKARLNGPTGYRADVTETDIGGSWVKVSLDHEMVITGIATQGYGDTAVSEWVTKYNLFYGDEDRSFKFFKDGKGGLKVFIGNKDRSTVRMNKIPLPVIASNVMLVPTARHNNAGLRMELYGCKPGYVFTAWLLVDRPYIADYNDVTHDAYISLADIVMSEVNAHFSTTPGFLVASLRRFSPQTAANGLTRCAAEIKIVCLPSAVQLLLGKLGSLRKSMPDLFDPKYLELQYHNDCNCRPPEITITGLSTSASNPAVVYSTKFRMMFDVTLTRHCNTTNNLLLDCGVSKQDPKTLRFLPFRSCFMKGAESSVFGKRGVLRKMIMLPSFMYRGSKLFYVRFVAKMIGISGTTNYRYSFYRIVKPPVIPNITGRKIAVKGKEYIRLDASKSIDPTRKKARYFGLSFAWYCRRKEEVFSNTQQITDRANGRSRTNGGCFGYGPGRLSQTSRLLSVNTKDMVSAGDYVFKMRVTARDNRSSEALFQVKVVPVAVLNIRCSNCGTKLSPRLTDVQFDAHCTGLACSFGETYKWRIYKKVRTVWNEIKIRDRDKKSTNSSSFNINSLDSYFPKRGEDQQFKIECQLYKGGILWSEASRLFQINAAPTRINSSAGCFVAPLEGVAISTEFTVYCQGWIDDDMPLSYQFNINGEFGLVVLARGLNPRVTSTLPPGSGEDSELKIQVLIRDSLGDGTSLYIPVKVNAPKMGKASTEKVQNLTDSVIGFVAKDEIDKAAERALSVIQTAERVLPSEPNRTRVKDKILSAMEHARIVTLPQVSKVVAVVAAATNQQAAISRTSQFKAIAILGSSAKVMVERIEAGHEDMGLVTNITSAVLQGVENVLNGRKTSDVTVQALSVADTVADGLLSLKSIGEPPTVVRSKKTELLVYRQTSAKIGNKTLLEGQTGVQLPSSDVLFGGKKSSMNYIDVQMLTYSDNPYTWSNSSLTVSTSVVDIALKYKKESLVMENLKEPFRLVIPTKSSKGPSANYDNQSTFYFVKPSRMQYHSFNITSKSQVVTITIKPADGSDLDIYLSPRRRPTLKKHLFFTRIPDFSNCKHSIKIGSKLLCGSHPYKFSISSKVTGAIGVHYIGVKYVLRLNNSNEHTRVKRDCGNHSGRQKRSCVGVKDPPPTTSPPFFILKPSYNESTDVTYTLDVSLASCVYWSPTDEMWTARGCEVALESTPTQLHCLCSHMSAFGGDFFVAPNPIDFDKVLLEFGRLGETGNFVCLGTVLGIWLFYFISIVFARRADINDAQKVAVTKLQGNNRDEGCTYKLSIQTGMWYNNGTTANVVVMLYGLDQTSEEIQLTPPESDRRFFARGSVNNFHIKLPDSLGPVYKMKVWHDNSGESPSWFLVDVFVVDLETKQKYHFVANRWLAVHKEDHEIECTLEVTKDNEKLSFKNLFYARVSKKLGEGHLWISIFSRPPQNPFTRCQRLSCCLSILFAAMITNAMFYRFGVKSSDAFYIGSIKISITELKIGIQSALIALPVNIMLVVIFRNVRPSTSESTVEGIKPPGRLPHFFLYIGWVICILSSLASSVFVVFYSLMWGKETVNQWLVSIMVSFIQDVAVMQPIKVIMLATVLSLIFKRPDEHEDVRGATTKTEPSIAKQQLVSSKPCLDELEKTRDRTTKEYKVLMVVREISLFLIFLVLLNIVVYGNRGKIRYTMTNSFESLVKGFDGVRGEYHFWNWMESTFLPKMYNHSWYNGQDSSYLEGFLSNKDMFMVGMPRLRQLRVKRRVCDELLETSVINHFDRCITPYSSGNEEKSRYNLIGWKPVTNISIFKNTFELNKYCPKYWRYRTAWDLKVLPFKGEMFLYTGGGYVADLGYTFEQASSVIEEVKKNRWIDYLTAAVFLECTVFEPSSQLYTFSTMLFEKLPTGGISVSKRINTLTVYLLSSQGSTLYTHCQPLFLLIVLLLFVLELKNLFRQGKSYFKSIWNYLNLLQCIGSVAAVVVSFLKQKSASDFVRTVQENPFQTTSPHVIILWSEVEIYILSAVIFIATIKCLRIIRFNRHICQMTATIQVSAKYLSSYIVVFVITVMAFCEMAVTCFGSQVPSYSSLLRSLGTLLQLLIGGSSRLSSIRSADPMLGPLFTLTYLFVAGFILVNVFIAILNESYESVRNIKGQKFEDADLGRFMLVYFKELRINLGQKLTHWIKDVFAKQVIGTKYEVQKRQDLLLRRKTEKKFQFCCKDIKVKQSLFPKTRGRYDFMLTDNTKGYHYEIIANEIPMAQSARTVRGLSYKPFDTPEIFDEGSFLQVNDIPLQSHYTIVSEKSIQKLEVEGAKLATFDSDDSLGTFSVCDDIDSEDELLNEVAQSMESIRFSITDSNASSRSTECFDEDFFSTADYDGIISEYRC